MFEGPDHRVLHSIMAPPSLSGGALSFPLILAEWAIYIGPAQLVLLWSWAATPSRHDRYLREGDGWSRH